MKGSDPSVYVRLCAPSQADQLHKLRQSMLTVEVYAEQGVHRFRAIPGGPSIDLKASETNTGTVNLLSKAATYLIDRKDAFSQRQITPTSGNAKMDDAKMDTPPVISAVSTPLTVKI